MICSNIHNFKTTKPRTLKLKHKRQMPGPPFIKKSLGDLKHVSEVAHEVAPEVALEVALQRYGHLEVKNSPKRE